jgi:hypothetical protein
MAGSFEPADPDAWRIHGIADSLTRTGFFFGTPEDAAAALLERTRGLPVDHLHECGTLPGIDERLAERNVELAVSRLRPLVAD